MKKIEKTLANVQAAIRVSAMNSNTNTNTNISVEKIKFQIEALKKERREWGAELRRTNELRELNYFAQDGWARVHRKIMALEKLL